LSDIKAPDKTKESPGSSAFTVKSSSKIGENEKVLLTLHEHPFVKKPMISAMALILTAMVSYMSYFLIPHPFMPLLVFIFFIISNTSFFMPTEYIFTEEKVVVNRIVYRQGYLWSRFRGYTMDKNGVYLSPLSNPDKFDRFRGVFLVMSPENRKLLKPILEEKIVGSNVSGTTRPKGN
jgi:hypothetical protein